MRWFFSIN